MEHRTAFCFDLDGTVSIDEILPRLSLEVGLYEEISALTEATIKGVIPFERSFRLRCRLLAEISVSKVREIISGVRLYEDLANFIRANAAQCFVITGNLDIWVEPLIASLGCEYFSSKATAVNDKLVSVDMVLNKGAAVKELRKRFDKVVAVGDGMGDVQMFEEADFRVAFGASHDPIEALVQSADYVTYSEKALCRLLNTQL